MELHRGFCRQRIRGGRWCRCGDARSRRQDPPRPPIIGGHCTQGRQPAWAALLRSRGPPWPLGACHGKIAVAVPWLRRHFLLRVGSGPLVASSGPPPGLGRSSIPPRSGVTSTAAKRRQDGGWVWWVEDRGPPHDGNQVASIWAVCSRSGKTTGSVPHADRLPATTLAFGVIVAGRPPVTATGSAYGTAMDTSVGPTAA